MKKLLCFSVVFIMFLTSLCEANNKQEESGYDIWNKALGLVVQCKQNFPFDLACVQLRLNARTIIKGKNITRGAQIKTRGIIVGFLEVKSSIEIVPYDGDTVTLEFSGEGALKSIRVVLGFGKIVIIRMTKDKPSENNLHITAYVPMGSFAGFARVDGDVSIVNESYLEGVVKRGTSKTTFKSIQR